MNNKNVTFFNHTSNDTSTEDWAAFLRLVSTPPHKIHNAKEDRHSLEREDIVQTITSQEGFATLENNSVLGTLPTMSNARIEFAGTGNVLYCEEGVKLNGTIRFPGNNALVVLRASNHLYRLDLTVHNHCLFYSGNGSYFNGALHAICSEGCSIVLGDDCLYSFGIWIRTADPHLVYDATSKRRLNPSKDVLVGDHVWVGQDAMILKGTHIGSGSILGARAVTSGELCSNASWAGVPARCLREDIFWDDACVHPWTPEQTEKSQVYQKEPALFRHDGQTVRVDELLACLREPHDAEQRLAVVKERLIATAGNRFYLGAKTKPQDKASRGALKSAASRLFGRGDR